MAFPFCPSVLVSGHNLFAYCMHWCQGAETNRQYTWHNPKKVFNSARLHGGFISRAATLTWTASPNFPGSVPLPRKSVFVAKIFHFLRFNARPAFSTSDRTVQPCDICLSAFWENIIISWRYSRSNCHFIGNNIYMHSSFKRAKAVAQIKLHF